MREPFSTGRACASAETQEYCAVFTYDLTDEDYELPYNAPGRSRSYFELDDEFDKGVAKRRSDAIKLETILGNSGDMDLENVGGPDLTEFLNQAE
jgi:hypothetical protein